MVCLFANKFVVTWLTASSKGVENSGLSSDEAIDLVSFLAASLDPALHHFVHRSSTIFAHCNNLDQLTFESLPHPDTMLTYVVEKSQERMPPGNDPCLDEQKRFMDLLRDIRLQFEEVSVTIQSRLNFAKTDQITVMKGRGIGVVLESLLERLKYKERYLQTVPTSVGLALPSESSETQSRANYAGSRWESVQALLRRAHDFDARFDAGHNGQRLDMFLRECQAYATERFPYVRRRAYCEVTLSTMHYAQGYVVTDGILARPGRLDMLTRPVRQSRAEYDAVFVSGMEDGSMPDMNCHGLLDLAVERKLLFLTVLRARHRVYFNYLQGNPVLFHRSDDDGCAALAEAQQVLTSNERGQRRSGQPSAFLTTVLPLLNRR